MKKTTIIVILLFAWVFLSTLFSMKGDSLTMDELAHLPAGYSYLTQKDMRLNPEHPPLIKDLAAIPLLFIKHINFPSDIKAWKEDVNGQWDFGNQFLFKYGNPADQLIFWGRLPMIILLLLLGFYIFKFARERFGKNAALLSLFLFAFSPALLAHGRLVTTDVGAAFGAVFATYYFLKALENPDRKTLIIAGLTFGIAELLKFSLILLIPFFIFLGIARWLIKEISPKDLLRILVSVFVLGFLLVGLVYQYHVLNYPPEKQLSDTKFVLDSSNQKLAANLTIWMADKPILRAFSQYSLGLLMVFQRATGGNTTYFLGEVSAAGWKNYFPTVYLLKEPLTFHILAFISLLSVLLLIRFKNGLNGIFDWLKNHFPEFSLLSFIVLYWLISLKSNLNIGVRHLLPLFPFTIMLTSMMTIKLLKKPYLKLRYAILGVLVIWQAASVISVYPSFLAYFNESIGGPVNGYKYVVDSNLDWGQDLKRLASWIEKKNGQCALIETAEPCGINKIYVDYFGGSNVNYYLQKKYAPWQGNRDLAELPKGSYLAISATFLQGGRGTPAPGFDQPTGYYRWLDAYEPVAKIGNSIFVYYIP